MPSDRDLVLQVLLGERPAAEALFARYKVQLEPAHDDEDARRLWITWRPPDPV
jgi:hypothetical protein